MREMMVMVMMMILPLAHLSSISAKQPSSDSDIDLLKVLRL